MTRPPHPPVDRPPGGAWTDGVPAPAPTTLLPGMSRHGPTRPAGRIRPEGPTRPGGPASRPPPPPGSVPAAWLPPPTTPSVPGSASWPTAHGHDPRFGPAPVPSPGPRFAAAPAPDPRFAQVPAPDARFGPATTPWSDPTTPAPRPTPAGPSTPHQGVELSAWSLAAVAVALATLFVWVLALPCGLLGAVAIARERHNGTMKIGFGIAALVVAFLARVAMRTFESWGPFF